jgi:HK97 family phage major capsid protein
MLDLREQVSEAKKQLDAKKAKAADAWKDLEQTKEELKDVDILSDAAAFQRLDDVGKVYDGLKDEITDLETKWSRLVELYEQESPNKDDEPRPSDNGGKATVMKSIGSQFVEAEGYKTLVKGGHLPNGKWKSDEVEIDWQPFQGKATLTSDPASGGDLIVPDYRPGITPILFRRLVVAELFPQGNTRSNIINYMKETTATNAAAATSEGAAKPESTLIFDLVSDPVRKVATFLPIADEMLEDWEQARSYLDGRLEIFVLLTEEDQLLNGNGTAPNILGILNRTGLQTPQARGTDSRADAVHKMITKIRAIGFLEPEGIVFHPNDWEEAALEKDANGQYYGGGPFAGPYGVGQIGSELAGRTYWGLRPVVTPAIAENSTLVGAFQTGAQIFRRRGLTIEASNSHADFFQKDLTALRAYERLALAVYRPQAFGVVTGM